jgi:hypothetical protein
MPTESEDAGTSSYWLGAVDARPLAIFRIALGLVLLQDLYAQARGLEAFYTDQGIFPRAPPAMPWMWSVFQLTGTTVGVTLLFATGALATLAFTAGLFTRVATAATWVLFVSLEHRVPEIHNGGDRLAALLLFFGAFANLSGRYSLDALRSGGCTEVPALAPRLLQATPVLLYFSTAIEKIRDAGWGWFDGSVISANVRLRGWTRFGGVWLQGHPSLCTAIGAATIVIELAIPLLFYSPFAPRVTRLLAIIGHVGLQVGILLSFKVAMFTYVALATTPLWFVPSWLDRFEAKPLGGSGSAAPRLDPAGLLLVGIFALVAIAPHTPKTVGRVLPWTALDLNVGLFAWAYPSMHWEPRGELEDGRAVDPLPPDADFSDRFTNSLWMQLPYRLQDYGPLGRMVCERFESHGGPRLRRWSLTRVIMAPYREGEPPREEKRRIVLEQDCDHR